MDNEEVNDVIFCIFLGAMIIIGGAVIAGTYGEGAPGPSNDFEEKLIKKTEELRKEKERRQAEIMRIHELKLKSKEMWRDELRYIEEETENDDFYHGYNDEIYRQNKQLCRSDCYIEPNPIRMNRLLQYETSG